MKIFETTQRAEGGGFPLNNDNGVFSHGDNIVIIDRNEFLELLDELRLACSAHYKRLREIEQVLREAGSYTHSLNGFVSLEAELGKE